MTAHPQTRDTKSWSPHMQTGAQSPAMFRQLRPQRPSRYLLMQTGVIFVGNSPIHIIYTLSSMLEFL